MNSCPIEPCIDFRNKHSAWSFLLGKCVGRAIGKSAKTKDQNANRSVHVIPGEMLGSLDKPRIQVVPTIVKATSQ